MRPYSADLRERIVNVYENMKLPLFPVADLFNVSVSSVKRFVKQKRETGSLSPVPSDNGSSPETDEVSIVFLKDILKRQTDLSQNELRERPAEEKGTDVSQPAVSRTLKRAGITLKKKRKKLRNRSGKISGKNGSSLRKKLKI